MNADSTRIRIRLNLRLNSEGPFLTLIRDSPRESAAKTFRSGTTCTNGLLSNKTQGGRNYAIRFRELLFVVFDEEASLLHFLATYAVAGPGHRFQTLLRNRLLAANAFAIAAIIHAHQRFID